LASSADVLSVHEHGAGVRGLETGHDAQRRGLAAPGRPKQRDELAGQHDPPQRGEPAGPERASRLEQRLEVERAQPGVDRPVRERHRQDQERWIPGSIASGGA